MNKRIRELAKEADEYADATLSPGEFHPDWHDVRDARFAELIVKECCQKLENDGMVEVAMEMKQHFGVE